MLKFIVQLSMFGFDDMATASDEPKIGCFIKLGLAITKKSVRIDGWKGNSLLGENAYD